MHPSIHQLIDRSTKSSSMLSLLLSGLKEKKMCTDNDYDIIIIIIRQRIMNQSSDVIFFPISNPYVYV